MLKISYAGCLNLSPVISAQFTSEMCEIALASSASDQLISFSRWSRGRPPAATVI